jgi:Flp pilus assembly protein CpaB
MLRAIYVAVFVTLSSTAGLFYYSQTRQATAVVAAQDLPIGHQIQDGDLATRQVNPASLPTGIVQVSQDLVGEFVAVPVLKGQFIQLRQVVPSRSGRLLTGGLEVPAGSRIISLPVSSPTAVGGVLRAGDLVDVVAIPNALKTTGPDEVTLGPEVIGRRVLVLGLRTEQGTEVSGSEESLNAGTNKAASMLLAIPAQDESKYSLAVSTSTFFFAMATD